MNCHESKKHLSAFHDGELRDGLRESLETHLAECHACRSELDAYGRLSEIFATAPPPDAPAGLWQKIEKAAAARRRPRLLRRLLPRAAAAGIAFVAFLGTAWSLGLIQVHAPAYPHHQERASLQAPEPQDPLAQVIHETMPYLSGARSPKSGPEVLARRPEGRLLASILSQGDSR